MSQRWVSLVVVLAACGGPSSPAPDESATSPDAAVRQFMQAVADSNINRMGRYWGTAKGPARIVNQPADHEKRLVVTQAFLRGPGYRILDTEAVAGDGRRAQVKVSLDRRDLDGSTCVKTAPFTVVNTGRYGWIVSGIDLNLIGTPGRSCSRPAPSGNSAG